MFAAEPEFGFGLWKGWGWGSFFVDFDLLHRKRFRGRWVHFGAELVSPLVEQDFLLLDSADF